MKNNSNNPRLSHTFVVCTYKDSDYLEECIKSILNQTLKSDVIISTSTPTDKVKKTADMYGIKLYEHNEGGTIGKDWNYGFGIPETKYVTIAHQDDIYLPRFAETNIGVMEKSQACAIAFSNYDEIDKDSKRLKRNINLRIKDMMLVPIRLFPNNVWIRRKVISFGNPICCPAITYNKQLLNSFAFSKTLRFVVDWDGLVRINKKNMSWQYNNCPLLLHRIHAGSETTFTTGSGIRVEEEQHMFEMFWPKFIAQRLARVYRNSENTNNTIVKR